MKNCPNLQKSLDWCEGTPQYPGIRRRLYYINKNLIVDWPTLERDDFGRIIDAHYIGAFTIAADAAWQYIDINIDKSTVTSEPQGEVPSQTQLNKATFVHNGIDAEATAAAGYLNNADCVFVYEDMIGHFRVLGNNKWRTKITVNQDQGQGTNPASTTINIEVTDMIAPPFYVEGLETEDGEVFPSYDDQAQLKPRLTSPSGTLFDVGTLENDGFSVQKEVLIKGANLTQGVTLSVTGTGFLLGKTSLTAEQVNEGTNVKVIFSSEVQGPATTTGALTISSGEVEKTIAITASKAGPKFSILMSKSYMNLNPNLRYGTNLTDNRWTYQCGLIALGVLSTYDNYKDSGEDVSGLLSYVTNYYHNIINGDGINDTIVPYKKADYNSDMIQPGYNLFRLKQLDSNTTYQNRYDIVIGQLATQLVGTAANNYEDAQARLVEPTTVPGKTGHPFQHKKSYLYQHWLDGCFMVQPFLALCARDLLTGQAQTDAYNDIVEQLINTAALTYDADTHLYRHAYAGQGSAATWSENGKNTTGRARYAWGRAMGWYIMGICFVLDIIPSSFNPARRKKLTEILSDLLNELWSRKDASGVWRNLPTVLGEDEQNKLEATSTSMYVYGFLHGVRKGYLLQNMMPKAKAAYEALISNFVTVTSSNNQISVTLNNCVTGGNPGATTEGDDGVKNNYYSKSYASNDFHGVGPFILASLEYELLSQNND